ncbi:glycine betaine ABC transporter substrate-binding protein [Phyllobacterium sophorae]
MWRAVSEGQLDAALEVWSSNVTEQYRPLNSEGKVEDHLGSLGLVAREGFVYPPHVASLCPGPAGLASVEELRRICHVVATPRHRRQIC